MIQQGQFGTLWPWKHFKACFKSVMFNNLSNYSDSLKSLANNFSDPNFAKQMNLFKDEQLKKFKRKKNIFYNYIF